MIPELDRITDRTYALGIKIELCTSVEQERWLHLRQQLWPNCPLEDHLSEMSSFGAHPERFVQFVAYAASGQAVGFIEVQIRSDYVNGTESSPVAFLEGIYVVPEARRTGIARALVAIAERWAINRGCREFASDAALENEPSHAMHRALGFHETERVVLFFANCSARRKVSGRDCPSTRVKQLSGDRGQRFCCNRVAALWE